jgi:hypothetical protein
MYLPRTLLGNIFNVNVIGKGSDGHKFVTLLHRYRYIVSNDRYKRPPSVISLLRSNENMRNVTIVTIFRGQM